MTRTQDTKTYRMKLAQPLSIVPEGERVISRSSSRSSARPPNQSVVFPNLLLGRRTRLSLALISFESGSLSAIREQLSVARSVEHVSRIVAGQTCVRARLQSCRSDKLL